MPAKRDRLTPLYARLTAQERAIAELEAYRAGVDPDIEIRTTMPTAQHAEFARWIARLHQLDERGSDWLRVLSGATATIALRLAWLRTLQLLDWRLEPLRDASRGAPPGDPLRRVVVDTLEGLAFLVPARQRKGEHTLAGGLEDRVAVDVGQVWQALLALESEVDVVAGALGVDPVLPPLRDDLENLREQIEDLAAHVALPQPCARPDPDPDLTAAARRWLRPELA